MKNWKTSLFGGLTAALLVILNLLQHGTVDLKTLIIAGGIALLGFVAKDNNVTGGTVQQ